MKKIKVLLIGDSTTALPANVQATLKAGLALVFDALNDVPGGITPEIIGDLQLQLASYHPGNPTSFQQWLTDGNALVQAIATDTGNAKVEEAATWIGQISMLLAGGKSVGTSIFLSLFKKHSATAVKS